MPLNTKSFATSASAPNSSPKLTSTSVGQSVYSATASDSSSTSPMVPLTYNLPAYSSLRAKLPTSPHNMSRPASSKQTITQSTSPLAHPPPSPHHPTPFDHLPPSSVGAVGAVKAVGTPEAVATTLSDQPYLPQHLALPPIPAPSSSAYLEPATSPSAPPPATNTT